MDTFGEDSSSKDSPDGGQGTFFHDETIGPRHEGLSSTTRHLLNESMLGGDGDESRIEPLEGQAELPVTKIEESPGEAPAEPIAEPEVAEAPIDEETIRLAADFTVEAVDIVANLELHFDRLRFAIEIPGCSKINLRTATPIKKRAWEYTKKEHNGSEALAEEAVSGKAARLLGEAQTSWHYWENFGLEDLKVILTAHFKLVMDRLNDREPGILEAVEEGVVSAESTSGLFSVLKVFYTGKENKAHRSELNRVARHIAKAREAENERTA